MPTGTTVWGTLALSLITGLLGARNAHAQSCVAWVAGGTYTPGEVVTYNGATYTSLINQTDVAGTGWVPTVPGLFVLGGSCSGSTSTSPPTSTPAPGITSGASYNVINPLSGLALDISGCGNANGTPVDLWAKGVSVCNNGAGQVWSPTLNSDGTYTLINPASGLVLDVAGCGAANGTGVQIWANGVGVCDGGAGQKWAIDANSDGTYTLVNPLTSNALDVSGCGTSNGTRVQTWANGVNVCDGGAGQKWQFAAATTTGTPPSSGTGKIVGGYYPWWVASPVRLINVPSVYNLIYLFAATTAGGGADTGAVTFTLPADNNGAATNWAADIQTVRNVQHRKVILSVGGSGYAMAFPNRAYSQTFLDSVEALYNAWGGFDGLDWNTFEGISPDVSEMIWVSQQLKAAHPGFIISAPPAPWNTSDQQLCVSMLQAGALDYCAPQYYDGPNLADPSWILPNVDVWMGLIPQKNFVFGFGIDPDLANYETIAVGISVWQSISAKYPSIGGAFDWQINEDLLNGGPFVNQLAPLVNPGGAPANVP